MLDIKEKNAIIGMNAIIGTYFRKLFITDVQRLTELIFQIKNCIFDIFTFKLTTILGYFKGSLLFQSKLANFYLIIQPFRKKKFLRKDRT